MNAYYCRIKEGVLWISPNEPDEWPLMTHVNKPEIINAPNMSVAKRVYEADLANREWNEKIQDN